MKVGLIGFDSVNLGDDLQSIAVSLNLPFVDRFVARDTLATLSLPERHFVLMNAWFTKQKFLHPSKAIDPLFFGFCLGRDEMRFGLWPRYLKRHEPIGCRDTSTVERLAKAGVDGHWSGCLTLRIGSFLRPVPPEERKGVFIVDVLPGAEYLIPADIRERATRISNAVPPAILNDPLARMAQIARICDQLRRAELVVTKRLHTALPCVGFSTPVAALVLSRKGNHHRFSGFDDFVTVRYHSSRAPDLAPIDWPNLRPAAIPQSLNDRFERLRIDIAERLGAVADTRYDNLYRRDLIEIPNPGLGDECGRVAIDLGTVRVERVPISWTNKTIQLDLESFASFERFRAPILVRGNRTKEWQQVARVDQVLRPVAAQMRRLSEVA
jgi:hypothetical protein